MYCLLLSLLYYAPFILGCNMDFPDIDFQAIGQETMIAGRSTATLSLTTNEALLSNAFDNISLSTWSSYYTHGAHLAGMNKSMAEWTAEKWNENGIASSLVEYSVLLDDPVSQSLTLKFSNGTTQDFQLEEDGLLQDETTDYPTSIPVFHGYSATGDVEAEYVYVGTGHKDDFARLVSLGVELEGKIALTNYGGPYRGLKVKNAQDYGMVGVIIFTDPGNDGSVTVANGYAAYPDGPARNPSSVQRGTLIDVTQMLGDPTTPGWPSKPGCQRTDGSDVLPRIPSIPISQRNALPLLQALNGYGCSASNVSRDGWTGGLNASYSTGPAPGTKLHLSNVMKSLFKSIWNVIGIINGTNADETIIVGNHRDAWIVGGAADPNSGTAVLVELTKAFGTLLKTGWVPRRNIVFASWDGEEYAAAGSTEWVEEYAPWLSATAITYINMDIAVSGPVPAAFATPELHGFANDIMTKVIYPAGSNSTLYDAWHSVYKYDPESWGFGDFGTGSDYTAFLQYGIGSFYPSFGGGSKDPVYHYHSNYDSYHWMTNYGDPTFSIHKTIGQFVSLLTYHLADDPILSFDLSSYGRHLDYWIRDQIVGSVNTGWDTSNWGAEQTAIHLTDLINASGTFKQRVKDFQTYTGSGIDFVANTTAASLVNGKLRDFQRVWVSQGALKGREFYRNLAYAPDPDNGYSALLFPGFIAAWKEFTDTGDITNAANEVSKLIKAVNIMSDTLKIS